MKTIYLIRHSKAEKYNIWYKHSSLQTKNEKKNLSKEGKTIAKDILNKKEYDKIEEIYSSNYNRAFQTAKILAKRLKLKVKIDNNFGERKIGIKTWDEFPEDFFEHQFKDYDFKLKNGESLNNVKERTFKSLKSILNNSQYNTIAIFSHSKAIMSLLSIWCDIKYKSTFSFKNKIFFNGEIGYCDTFKLEIDDNNNLISIENVK